MSTPNGEFPNSNYFCHTCGRINSNQTFCSNCQSEFLEEIPSQTLETDNNNNQQQISLINQFQNLFTNTLLPMLMSQIQSDHSQYYHRRNRSSRRIKRVVHQYLPTSFQTIHRPLTQIRLFNINELIRGQTLNTQLIIFDQNQGIENISQTQYNLNQLPTLSMTPSNLLINPSCAICLENFSSTSEVKQLPICHHVFHKDCLMEWLIQHDNCPMCRTNISSIQQRQISLFNTQWIQQLFNPTNEQQTSSNHSLSDSPQLPHFDSSTNPD